MKIYTFPVQVADQPNLNNRVYTKDVLKNIVEKFKTQKHPLLGTIGMVEFTKMPDAILDPCLVSHTVEDLRLEDDVLIADIQVLQTPMGNELANIIDSDNIAFRMAGTATTNTNDKNVITINDDYNLLAINACPKTEAA